MRLVNVPMRIVLGLPAATPLEAELCHAVALVDLVEGLGNANRGCTRTAPRAIPMAGGTPLSTKPATADHPAERSR